MIGDGFEFLSEESFLSYCFDICDSHLCVDMQDVHDALRYVGYIKRLFTEFDSGTEIKHRLILNHIITLGNIFPPPHCVRILFFRTSIQHYSLLKTFLSFLDIMPIVVDGLSRPIYDRDIPINNLVKDKLDSIVNGV